ncbi:MAG: Gfo/Idh/MocA family oxidoreductase [Gloeobacteraceae cyanobacterium ES-bin-144]|nr:Gfo/Idh/MocA family oxidoreductase [Verrucomicrobiales bacterium]
MQNSSEPNRREFLKQNGLLSAGLILGSAGMARALDKAAPSEVIHIAIVGFGVQGEVLLHAMANIPGVRVQCICDIWDYHLRKGTEKVRAQQGEVPNAYTDIDEMLEKEQGLDAAIITTPDVWHAPHTIRCLEAGLHVYCEKMMSNTLEGARSMVQAAEKTKKLCQIGHQRRSNPFYRHTAEKLLRDKKLLGTILSASAQWIRTKEASSDIVVPEALHLPLETLNKYGYKDMRQFLNWRWFSNLSGGLISDLGAHQIDIFNWYLGSMPKRLTASGGKRFFKDRDHFDQIMVLFEYPQPDGGVCRVNYQIVCGSSGGGGNFETFLGDEGTIVASEQGAKTAIYREADAPFWDEFVLGGLLTSSVGASGKNSSSAAAIGAYESESPEKFMIPVKLEGTRHTPHLENFFNAIRSKEKLHCDAHTAFLSEAVIHYVNAAASNGGTLTLTESQLSL